MGGTNIRPSGCDEETPRSVSSTKPIQPVPSIISGSRPLQKSLSEHVQLSRMSYHRFVLFVSCLSVYSKNWYWGVLLLCEYFNHQPRNWKHIFTIQIIDKVLACVDHGSRKSLALPIIELYISHIRDGACKLHIVWLIKSRIRVKRAQCWCHVGNCLKPAFQAQAAV